MKTPTAAHASTINPGAPATNPPPRPYEELVTRRLEAALEEIRGEGWRAEITNLDPAKTPCCHLGRVDRRTIQRLCKWHPLVQRPLLAVVANQLLGTFEDPFPAFPEAAELVLVQPRLERLVHLLLVESLESLDEAPRQL